MKKKTLLFTVLSGIIYLSVTSYKAGPSTNSSAGNSTGSPGATNPSCAKAGCHDMSANTIIDSIVVRDKNTNASVDGYVAGRTYKISLCGHNASYTNFGFQACILKNSDNATIGTLATGTTANVAVKTVGAIKVIEHTNIIPATGTILRADFEWAAPSTSSGAVTIYTMLNAVNNNGASTNDATGNGLTKVLADKTGIDNIENTISLQAFPNPVKNYLNLKMENAATGNYIIVAFDMTGKKVAEEKITVTGSTYNAIINTNTWASGIYQLQISKDGQVHTLPVVKQ